MVKVGPLSVLDVVIYGTTPVVRKCLQFREKVKETMENQEVYYR